MTPRVLVAGIGNVFFGDDAFGVEVAQRLAGRPVPDGVEVVDVGIRGVHLAYQLFDGYDLLVLVDATPRGEAPGTITVLEPDVEELRASVDPAETPMLDAHRLEPVPLLLSADAMGARPGRTLVVGCEPADLDDGIGLSPVVEAAIAPAVDLVLRLVAEPIEVHHLEPAAEGN